jgi:hypothetical protein
MTRDTWFDPYEYEDLDRPFGELNKKGRKKKKKLMKADRLF